MHGKENENPIKTYGLVDLKTGQVLSTQETIEAEAKIVETALAKEGAFSNEMVKQEVTNSVVLGQLIKEVFTEGVHFGVIPNTSAKTIYQAGADILWRILRKNRPDARIEYEIDKFIDLANGLVDYDVKAILSFGNEKADEAVANANSMEAKFRSHFQKLIKPAKNSKDKFEPYWENLPNKSAFDIKNTLLQMSQKRAFVRLMRKFWGITGEFTQDVENMEITITKQKAFQLYTKAYRYYPEIWKGQAKDDSKLTKGKEAVKAYLSQEVFPKLKIDASSFMNFTADNVDTWIEYEENRIADQKGGNNE